MSDWSRRDFLKTSAAATGAVLVPRAARGQGGMDLVRNRQSNYAIVRSATASPSQIHAAEELQRLVEQMSGARLPILSDTEPLPPAAILLGETRYSAQILGGPLALDTLGDDGFRLVTRAPHLLILGSPVRGTLYGVYELLEKHGGCRWYATFHQVIPSRPTWSLPPLDDTQRPAFAMREPFWWDMFDGDQAARNRANGSSERVEEKHGGKIRFGGGLFVHTFFPLLPPGEFFASHPEYYSEINGKRVADHAQLCLTNPKVVELVTERTLARIRKDPTAKLFSVSQNDWHGYCTCANCKALDEREGSPSGTLIAFVNQVAEAVEKEFPEVWIETLAYQYTRHPPKTLRPRANVVPRLCTIECDFSKPLTVSTQPQNKVFVDDIQGWAAMTDKLYIWDYTTNFPHYVGPHPNFAALQGNVQLFRDSHVVGVFEQGGYQGPHAEFAELRAWLLAKLLWNPDVDLAPLYDDFFRGYYGPAAEPVRTYFDELQALVTGPEANLTCFSPMTAPYFNEAFFERATSLFNDAEARVKDDPATLYRVRMSALPVLYMRLQRWPAFRSSYRLEGNTLQPVGVPADYAVLASEALRRLEEGKVRLAESQDRHEAVLHELRGRSRGLPLLELKHEPLTAGVASELGAAVLSLTRDGQQYLSAAAGGVDAVEGAHGIDRVEVPTYQRTKATETEASFRYLSWQQLGTERRIELLPDRLRVTSSLISGKQEPITMTGSLRAGLSLGEVDNLYLNTGGGWEPLPLPADQTQALRAIAGALPAELTIASAATGRGVRLALPADQLERLLLRLDSTTNSIAAYGLIKPGPASASAPRALPLEIAPLPKVEGLPAARPPMTHHAGRVVVDDIYFRLGRIGQWGDFVADPEASDGYAAKLYNSHYEWCLTWPIRPELFEPGARYTARARLKVEHQGREGEAFWAGVYDTARKKGWGEARATTAKVEPGYQWYDLATWTPEGQQYVWVGPGVFDLKGGAKSAIEALYVDQFEFVKVD